MKLLPLGTAEHPVRKMIVVGSKIWCATKNVIKIVDIVSMEVEVGHSHRTMVVVFTSCLPPCHKQMSFAVVVKEDDGKKEARSDEAARPVLTLTHSGNAVWLVVERSAKVVAYHATPQLKQRANSNSSAQEESHDVHGEVESLIELKVTGVVNKVLSGRNIIIYKYHITKYFTCY